MPPKKLFVIVSTTLTVVFVAIFLSLDISLIGADSKNGSQKDLSTELGLSSGSVTLESETTEVKTNFKIARHFWVLERPLNLTGFEDEVSTCSDHKIDFPANSKSVCLAGEVGVHSMNLQIIRLTATGLKAVSFKSESGSISLNISADLPYFSFKDINNDGTPDIAAYNRDYDSDPLKYAIKSYYLGDKAENYYFDSTERIAYNVNDN